MVQRFKTLVALAEVVGLAPIINMVVHSHP